MKSFYYQGQAYTPFFSDWNQKKKEKVQDLEGCLKWSLWPLNLQI